MSVPMPSELDAWHMVAAGREFSGEVALASMSRLVALLAEPGGLCRYRVRFGRDALAIPFVELDVQATLRLLCQRTLQPFDAPQAIIQRLGLIRDEAQESMLPDGYEPVLPDADGTLRPFQLIEDELLLALPAFPVSPDSAPLDLSVGASEERKQAANPFAVLVALKDRK